MKLGMIGLGKKGFNLAQNLLLNQHQVTVYDVNPEPGRELEKLGAAPAASTIKTLSFARRR